jgi:hypothetical protein
MELLRNKFASTPIVVNLLNFKLMHIFFIVQAVNYFFFTFKDEKITPVYFLLVLYSLEY